MKPGFTRSFLTLALFAGLLALATQAADDVKTSSPLDGTWRWEFTMPDGGKITPTLRVRTAENGTIRGTTRFRSGTTTPVTNLTLKGNAVSFEVVRAREEGATVTRYTGIQNGDKIKGRMVSNWNGQEESYPWEAARYNEVEGTWKWRFNFGGGRGGDATLTLKRDGERLTGKLNMGRGAADIHHGRFRKGEVSFHTERERDGETFTNHYWGKFSGDTIAGWSTSSFGGRRTNEWRAMRAD
jgi:hypothetical protein